MIYKFAEFLWQIPFFKAETTGHSWIEGQGVEPRFLGHVMEAGRVIGLLMENISGCTANVGDLDTC
jgi:hypothetical protein